VVVAVKKHADASPSSSAQWLKCPASVTLARGRARAPTIYTAEGTVAHTVAEMMLREKHTDIPVRLDCDGFTIDVTPEMLDAVETYVEYVAALPGKKVYETKVHVDVDGEPLWGTADTIAYAAPLLEIVDLKYGQGVAVDPGTTQLKIYALGALEEVGPFVDVQEVRATIVQPRGGGVKSVVYPVQELIDWERDELRPAVARIHAGDTTEEAGSHCRWCVRAGECVTLANFAMAQARVSFPDLPPPVTSLSNEELGERLAYAETILGWVTAMRAEVSGRIDNGQEVPGWKLVPKRAMRRWDDPAGALLELDNRGIPLDQVTRIETIGNVEKVIKRRKLDPETVLYPYTVKESSGSTLVSEKDGRPAIDTSSKGLFSDISAFEADLLH